jgi:UDP-N-acetylmuramoyl-tripeptide--D-alanyl-D-alanine ligase
MSMRAAMDAFGGHASKGRKWLVLGGMLELGKGEEQEHIGVGEYVAKGVWDGLVVVGRLGEIMARGATSGGFDRNRIIVCGNNQECVEAFSSVLKAGDSVLFKASRGMKLEEVVSGIESHLSS